MFRICIGFGFNADPDPALYFKADPDPGSETNADPDSVLVRLSRYKKLGFDMKNVGKVIKQEIKFIC